MIWTLQNHRYRWRSDKIKARWISADYKTWPTDHYNIPKLSAYKYPTRQVTKSTLVAQFVGAWLQVNKSARLERDANSQNELLTLLK